MAGSGSDLVSGCRDGYGSQTPAHPDQSSGQRMGSLVAVGGRAGCDQNSGLAGDFMGDLEDHRRRVKSVSKTVYYLPHF